MWAHVVHVTGIRADDTEWSAAVDFETFVPSFFDVFVELQISGFHPTRNRRDFSIDNIDLSLQSAEPAPVPEPGTSLLLGAGLAALVARQQRRRQEPRT